ncbi:NAD(P)/FAD-dependent oxidoreductase [Streptomyces chartreusis]|uniref:NAD(P)/FAD-dependent oxidoreductase n=1 Tax=Streptomyces chartreusis TaxID=1969 RepID=UPI003693B322
MTHPGHVAVIGASAGGLATVQALRQRGYDGKLTLIGDEAHLPYDRPPLSKQILSGRWAPERLTLRSDVEIGALHLDLRLGITAIGLDQTRREVLLSDETGVPYEVLVVATGVHPRSVPLSGAETTRRVHTLRTLEDAQALRARLRPGRRLVIAGAGLVGTEVAATARSLGVDVTLVEPAPMPLAHAVGRDVGRWLMEVHRAHGVDLLTAVAVTEVVLTSAGEVDQVVLSDGSVLSADDVLVAAGSQPNTQWLVGSGLSLADGLVCDEFSRAAPSIYGVGDVARWFNPLFGTSMRVEHRTNAAEQGLTVAHNILTPQAPRPFAPVPYFWTDQYDMTVQCYGFPRGHDECVVVDGDLVQGRFVVAYRTANRLAAVLTVGASPKTLRAWRAAILARASWAEALAGMWTAGKPEHPVAVTNASQPEEL